MPYIYKITNTINNKVYIGKTLFSVEHRWAEHRNDYTKERCEKRPLYSAMKKYGAENFTVETIEECTEQELSERETYWIEFYGSFKNGYNATVGGDGTQYIDYDLVVATYLQIKHQKKTAELLGIDPITVRKALFAKGMQCASSDEVNRIQSGIIVDMMTVDGEYVRSFPSAADALRFVLPEYSKFRKGAVAHITDVCKGKRQTAYGYKWQFGNTNLVS